MTDVPARYTTDTAQMAKSWKTGAVREWQWLSVRTSARHESLECVCTAICEKTFNVLLRLYKCVIVRHEKHEFALSFSFNIMNTNYQKWPFSVAIKTSRLFITGTVKPWTSVSLSCLCCSLAPKSPLLHSNSSFPRSKCIRHQQNRHTY